jgi:hypothetical protein
MTKALAHPLARRTLGIGAALAAGLILPLLVHLIPSQGGPPMGARLLPIFLAASLAAMRLDPLSALSIAVATPLLNRLVTGSPAGAMLPVVSTELVVTVALLLAARRFAPGSLRFVTVPAFLASAVIASALVSGSAPLDTLSFAVRFSWPGLVLLAVCGFLAAPRNTNDGPRSDGGPK